MELPEVQTVKLVTILIAIALAQYSLAAVCTVIGFTHYEDGSNATGINVTIKNMNYKTSYTTLSGGRDYPIRNIYMQSLTCEPNDTLKIEAAGFSQQVVFDHYPIKLNVTVDRADAGMPNGPTIQADTPVHEELPAKQFWNIPLIYQTALLLVFAGLSFLYFHIQGK
jgi:hypothetical protein